MHWNFGHILFHTIRISTNQERASDKFRMAKDSRSLHGGHNGYESCFTPHRVAAGPVVGKHLQVLLVVIESETSTCASALCYTSSCGVRTIHLHLYVNLTRIFRSRGYCVDRSQVYLTAHVSFRFTLGQEVGVCHMPVVKWLALCQCSSDCYIRPCAHTAVQGSHNHHEGTIAVLDRNTPSFPYCVEGEQRTVLRRRRSYTRRAQPKHRAQPTVPTLSYFWSVFS